jgi:FkbM family methyltransferase
MEELKQFAGNTTTIKAGKDIVLQVEGDFALLPASLKLPNGEPRFHLSFPRHLGNTDLGAKHLAVHELGAGYELPTRNLLERTLRPGDLFIDVGAHWGFFSLQAATHPAGVNVIAFEPDPTNASVLLRNIANHGLNKTVSVVCAACGNKTELAPLVTNSSMGHSVHGVGLRFPDLLKGPAHWISVVTLDSVLPQHRQVSSERIILKIDAEGFEPRIIEGARALLQSRRVAVIIWERGRAFSSEPDRDAMRKMVTYLSSLGFHHLRPVAHYIEGPLCFFSTDEEYLGNVFSYHPNVLSDFDKLLPVKSDDIGALNERGLSLHQQRRFEEALSVYQNALAIKPDVAEVLYNYGNALLELKRFEEALASYDKALAIKPDYVIALNNRGYVLQQLRRFDEALVGYDKALTIEPKHASTITNRAKLLQQLELSEASPASSQKMPAIRPDSANPLKNPGNAPKRSAARQGGTGRPRRR